MNKFWNMWRSHTFVHASILLLALIGWSAMASADAVEENYAVDTVHDSDGRVASKLIFTAVEVAPGDTFRVGVAFEIDPSWYIYWQNPGDAGIPTDIQWSGEGVSFGPLEWAAPSTFLTEDQASYGYNDHVVLYSEATVDDDASGEITIDATIDYLACNDLCLPGYAELSRSIKVGEETISADERTCALMQESKARVPQRATDLDLQTRAHFSTSAVEDSADIVLEIIACDADADACENDLRFADEDDARKLFVADGYSAMDLDVQEIRTHPRAKKGWIVHLEGALRDPRPLKNASISGVAMLEGDDGEAYPAYIREHFDLADEETAAVAQELPAWADEGEVIATRGSSSEDGADTELSEASDDAEAAHDDAAATPGISLDDEDEESSAPPNILWIILMAFLGGIILNLMPCVFPVLALKISSFATLAHESRKEVIRHGTAYTSGIMVTMWALAAAVIGLRLTGTQVGWGFQFQQPGFLAALIVILVLFSMNLFGVFEIAVSPQRLTNTAHEATGTKRSFFEGVLAVVLATPCSAPFLGAAVGFALSGSIATIVAVFTAMALGLAAPLVLLTLVPGWAKLLPQPGNWMVNLKTFLGFALMGSAVWILWLLGRAAGVDAMAAMMMFSGLLALAVWFYGLVQFQGHGRKKTLGIGLAIVVSIVGAYLTFPLPISTTSGAMAAVEDTEWKEWSEEGVQEALANGQPVFVDFTADWCLTCKVNKKNAINTPRTAQAIAEHNVATFRADWTHEDEDIRAKLAEFNRAGIPFYLVYSPENPDQPWTLSEIITEKTLINAFKRAAGDS